MMEIIKVPDGETKESFIKCRILNITRQIDLYKSLLNESECYDKDTQADMAIIEFKMHDLLKKMEEVKI